MPQNKRQSELQVEVKLTIQTESRQMLYRMNEIYFLISQAWVEGGIDVGALMQKIE